MHVSPYLGLLLFVSSLVAHRSSLVIVIVVRSLDAISDVGRVPVRVQCGRGGDYPMSAIIVSERAMANVMVATADDGGRIVGSPMAMRAKA